MSVTSGFFNSLSGDRKYDAIQISSMFDGLITDGIYNGFLESFMVTASSPASMVVTVGEGRCWFNHTWTLNDAPLPLTLDVGDVVLNRIDTIVIDVDFTDTVRACTIKVVKGSPSSQAVRPTLENTETHHQYPLCDISVPAGATTVTQSNITNRRGTSDCPFVATLMESVDVDDLLIQWESQWNDWMTDRADAMDTWTAEQQEAFTTWFQTVQDILDQDTAGNLLNRINHRTGINATATYSAGVVAITAPDDAGEILTFVAPSDFLSSDTYTLNGEALTITDLNGEALDDSWKKNSPVTITVSGGKAFFKAGGSGKNDTLPPLLGNMTVEVVEGDENDTYTIKMDKLILDKTTEMVGGAQLEWGEEMPAKPGKGTGGIKTWTREEIITTAKPYDGLYLGDVAPSDAVTETIIWLPENKDGKVVLEPFVILSTDYLGGVYLMRKYLWMLSTYAGKYPQSNINTLLLSYKNSVLVSDISAQVMVVPLPVYGESGDVYETDFFVPSMAELNFGTGGDIPTEGTMMPYFSSVQRRYAYVSQEGEKSGAKQSYWSRTGSISNSTAKYYVDTNGGKDTTGFVGTQKYIRPCFILPKDFKIQQRPDGSYTVWNEQGLMTLGDLEASTDVIETTVNAAEMYKSSTGPKAIITELSYDKKNYNKTDGGLLVRKELIKDSIAFSSGPGNYLSSYPMIGADEWATAEIGGVTRTDFVLLDSFKKILMSTPIKYRENGTVTKEVTKKGFLLSIDEVGNNHIWGDSATGEEIERYWNQPQNRISYYGNTKKGYWLRDGAGATKDVYTISASGTPVVAVSSNSYGIKVACVVPLTTPIRALADGSYDLVPDDPALATQTVTFVGEEEPVPDDPQVTHTVEVPHGQKVVFRQFTQNQKKQFQTMLVGGVYPPLGDVEPPFALPEFTGNHAIFGDEIAGRIELYEAGELTLSPGTYDFFLVGGGSNGNNSQRGSNDGAGGGAGGYTKTIKGVVIEKYTPMISVLVGAANSKTAITIGDQSYEALPGSASSARYQSGKNGGSGGGVGMYDGDNPSQYAPGLGGSDGSNGGSNSRKQFVAGTGQGTTTRAFEEASGTLFAGGGSGGTSSGRGYYAKPATEGGGGAGGNGSAINSNGGDATVNTGGGGGGAAGAGSSSASGGHGASGILIIRWNNVA